MSRLQTTLLAIQQCQPWRETLEAACELQGVPYSSKVAYQVTYELAPYFTVVDTEGYTLELPENADTDETILKAVLPISTYEVVDILLNDPLWKSTIQTICTVKDIEFSDLLFSETTMLMDKLRPTQQEIEDALDTALTKINANDPQAVTVEDISVTDSVDSLNERVTRLEAFMPEPLF